jgi:hypothetical protein
MIEASRISFRFVFDFAPLNLFTFNWFLFLRFSYYFLATDLCGWCKLRISSI